MLTLYELARGLTGQMQLPDIADVISKHLRRIVPALVSVFFVYKSDQDELEAAHASGDSSGVFSGLRIPLGHRITGWVAANRQTILNSDPVLDLGDVARSSRPRLRSCLSTPLIQDGKLVGVLSLYSSARDAFSENHRRIAEAVAKQVAPTIKSAAELEQREAYLRDDVTGLPTIDKLKQLSAAEKGGQAAENLSILFIDVAGLKEVQQELGRGVSDEILTRIVDRARRTLRGADLLFRFGTGEFVALLSETDARTASMIAAEISSGVAQIPFAREALKTSISVSIGVASSPSDGRSLEQLVGIARSRSTDDPRGTSDSVH
jgi:diguanylate cyclase (GGDEF)-like protein